MKFFVVYDNKKDGSRNRVQTFKSRNTAESFCMNNSISPDSDGYVIDEWEVITPGKEESKVQYRLMIMKFDGNLMEKYFDSYDECIELAKKSMMENLCSSYLVEKIEN